jgi:hypothetical protein
MLYSIRFELGLELSRIDKEAFSWTGLLEIVIGGSVEILATGCFAECKSFCLAKISIRSSLFRLDGGFPSHSPTLGHSEISIAQNCCKKNFLRRNGGTGNCFEQTIDREFFKTPSDSALALDQKLPVRGKQTIMAPKSMLMVFFNPDNVAVDDRLRKNE